VQASNFKRCLWRSLDNYKDTKDTNTFRRVLRVLCVFVIFVFAVAGAPQDQAAAGCGWSARSNT
jgi:hypothetical protein